MLNQIILKECNKLSEAEIQFRQIPFDNSPDHTSEILEKVRNKIATLHEVYEGNHSIGFAALEKYGGKLVVLAFISKQPVAYFERVAPLIEKLAKLKGCNTVSHSTVRPGGIRLSLANGYKITRVELEKTL